ncbi:MAG: hypothetical protein WAM14_09635 [Candidatus Nitrosopolaris sp.]
MAANNTEQHRSGDTTYTSNIQPLFKNAKEIAGRRPNTFITDGAPNFHDALLAGI